MINSVTYQGLANFTARLYALEVKSRFIDQQHADGYYKGYGSELEAKVIGNQIQISTGAFVVQGRMNEVVSAEIVAPPMYNNFVGYVVAHIETVHLEDDHNCSFKVYVNTAFSEIPLRQDDVYAMNADNENLVYELPIYSFEIKNGAITNLTKLIRAVDDYAKMQEQVQAIEKATADSLKGLEVEKQKIEDIANNATQTATDATNAANSATQIANNAKKAAESAVSVAGSAETNAVAAKEIADNMVKVVDSQHSAMTTEINNLAQQIGEKQGTTLTKDGVPIAKISTEELLADVGGSGGAADFGLVKYFDSMHKLIMTELSKTELKQALPHYFNSNGEYIYVPNGYTTDNLVGAVMFDMQDIADMGVEGFEECFTFINVGILYQPQGETTLFDLSIIRDMLVNNPLLAPFAQPFQENAVYMTRERYSSSDPKYTQGFVTYKLEMQDIGTKYYFFIFVKSQMTYECKPTGLETPYGLPSALYFKPLTTQVQNVASTYSLRASSNMSAVERLQASISSVVEKLKHQA